MNPAQKCHPKAVFLGLILGFAAWSSYALDTSAEEAMCKEIGFKPKTEKYASCVLELYERKSKASSGAMTQSQPQVRSPQVETAQQGDGTQDDQTCQRYGLRPGQPEYGNCRMQIDMAKQQVAREQARYQAELAAYEQQKKELEAERRRELGRRQLAAGLGLMSGQVTLQDLGRQSLGLPPPPAAPQIQNQTIRLPGGGIIHCTTSGTFTNCR
jgi:hypothetical protein